MISINVLQVADHTSIIHANKDLHTLESTVNLEFPKVNEWLKLISDIKYKEI